MPVIPTTVQPACWCHRDSAREENRGPLMTTSVPVPTATAGCRAGVQHRGRPRGQ